MVDTPIVINNEGIKASRNHNEITLSSIKTPGEQASGTDELKLSSLRNTRKSNPTPLLDAKMIK